jgi:energy-coupling factor transport system ATP-binding protein
MKKSLPLVMIDNINYSYPNGTQALRNISLTIEASEIIGIMGGNGAGKTTLIRTLNSLIKPQSGSIFIENEIITSKTIAELSRSVGIVFQNPEHQLFSNTVRDEIKFSLKNIYQDDIIKQKIDETLKLFRFERYEDTSPLNLSGGEKKKLALASVMCRDPKILIFDEPTLGQDKKELDFLIKLLEEELVKKKTIIIVTHNIEFAYMYLPRVILMKSGKIIADGPTKKILANKKLLQEASLISPQIIQLTSSLRQLGLDLPDNIQTQESLTSFLMELYNKSPNKGGR